MEGGDAARAVAIPAEKIIHAFRIGCFLHVLHLAVNAGMDNVFFMGPLGSGSWHEWPKQHLVCLLGSVWYNMSRSDVSNTTWRQFKRMVYQATGLKWRTKFVRPAETRWMVIQEAATLLEERWDQFGWIFAVWAPTKLLGTPFTNYWYKPFVMLKHPLIRVHAKFATVLGANVLNWAYNWIRGKGGYFIKRDDRVERLPPGMRLAEAPDFSLEFGRRLMELRGKPWEYFPDVLQFAKENLHEHEFDHFMENFNEESSSGFFTEAAKRWAQWADEHQHLLLSIAPIACSSNYRGKWAGWSTASEHAVGQEFARAFLFVLFPERYTWAPRTEREKSFRDVLAKDFLQAVTANQKYRLTLGLFLNVNEEPTFRAELEEYADSAFGESEIADCVYEDENPAPSISSFRQIWDFPLLYQWACYLIFFVPIHQQLVESFFSKYDTYTRKYDSKELDLVRTGQYRSAESVHTRRLDVTSKEIRDAGSRGISDARALREASYADAPYGCNHRKRDHDVLVYMAKIRTQKESSEWVVARSDEEPYPNSDGSSSSDGG